MRDERTGSTVAQLPPHQHPVECVELFNVAWLVELRVSCVDQWCFLPLVIKV